MDENPSIQVQTPAFDLALPVISALRDILEINLRGCNVWLKNWNSGTEVSVFVNSTTSAALVPESERLDVSVTAMLEVRKTAESDADLHIEAQFQISYKLKPVATELSQDNADAFASLNGLYNVWPYWREFVQSITTRMGLPPIVIPVFRIEQPTPTSALPNTPAT